MPDNDKTPTPPPQPLREVPTQRPGGEIKENSLPTFHNPPPPPPPPPPSNDKAD